MVADAAVEVVVGNKDKDKYNDFNMLGEDQMDEAVEALIGEQSGTEIVEQYRARKQVAKHNWSKAQMRVRDCKSKQAAKK